jgi:hypothetical protein
MNDGKIARIEIVGGGGDVSRQYRYRWRVLVKSLFLLDKKFCPSIIFWGHQVYGLAKPCFSIGVVRVPPPDPNDCLKQLS